MHKIIELRQKRAKLLADARALNDKVQGETRDFTAEEQSTWDKLMNDADALRTQIDREERLQATESELARTDGAHRDDPSDGNGDENEERQFQAFNRFLRAWVVQDFRQFRPDELRALQVDLDVSGGFLRPPQRFINQLIKNIDDVVYMRRWATVYPVNGSGSMGVPTLENDPADADWTTELATGSEDSTMSFGKRELNPHPLAKRIKISRKLLMAVPSASGLVSDRLSYKFGITQEKAFLTGSGAQQPLGVFVASNDGIPTSRDVSADNTATAPTFDGLINAKFSLKGQYWPRARWLAHRDFYKIVAKLKDGDGQYLWRESVRVGEPDTMLGIPAFMSEYAPATFTASQYVAILGDFSNYWIADSMAMEFQLLQELYAETNQVGMIGRLETDGMPTLAEAFARVKLAA